MTLFDNFKFNIAIRFPIKSGMTILQLNQGPLAVLLKLEIKERVVALRKERERRQDKQRKRHKRLFERHVVAPVVTAERPEREQAC